MKLTKFMTKWMEKEMKLSDWMAESIDRNACIEKALTEKYHVISTCPSCEHIERGKPPFDMGCRVIASWFGKEIMYWNSTAKDFDCVYWREKE